MNIIRYKKKLKLWCHYVPVKWTVQKLMKTIKILQQLFVAKLYPFHTNDVGIKQFDSSYISSRIVLMENMISVFNYYSNETVCMCMAYTGSILLCSAFIFEYTIQAFIGNIFIQLPRMGIHFVETGLILLSLFVLQTWFQVQICFKMSGLDSGLNRIYIFNSKWIKFKIMHRFIILLGEEYIKMTHAEFNIYAVLINCTSYQKVDFLIL